EDTAVAGNLLGNDSDIDGDPLEVTQVLVDVDGDGVADVLALGTPTALSDASGALIGTLTVGSDGSYVFTPAPNYAGPVPVASYTISDGAGGTASSTLEIAITPVDDTLAITGLTDGPVAGTDGTVDEGALADGTDPTSPDESVAGSFTVSVADGVAALEVNGTVL
ncbi:cadherin-like domain-containing protein, partial [Rhodalgimonas zhirmunskyi]